MTDQNQTAIRNFTRGGQILLHNFRMIKQVFDRVLVFCVVVFLAVSVSLVWFRTSDYQRYLAEQLCYAKFMDFFDSDSKQKVIDNNGEIVEVYSKQVINSPYVQSTLKHISKVIVTGIFFGIIVTLIFFVFVYIWLRRRGEDQTEIKKLRGDEIAELEIVEKLIRKTGTSDIKIGKLFMPTNFECGHILIHGTTGSGKSVCIKELLDQIRTRGDRAIIYDKSCDYVRSFYERGDVILNPLDERTASWHLWNECRDSADYDSLAAALMPMPAGTTDPFWINAARIIFAAAARQMQGQENRSMLNLLKSLLTADLAMMEQFLRGTEAATLVSEKIEKTAISIKSVLATYLKSLKYVKDADNPFSIREWVQDDSQNGTGNWLFISSLSDRHETLKPLISMWLDLAANALMSLTPSSTRRIWIVFDELPSLHKLPYLPEAFAESRKFGGCLVAGMQSIAQLRKIYGMNAAEEISTLCNTRIFFREPSAESALWVSKELGLSEVEEMKEGISYSESSMRSGISLAKHRHQKEVVNTSEIMRLDNLEAYVRLPGKIPITKIKLKYKERSESNIPFIPRKIDEKSLCEIAQVEKIEKMEKTNVIEGEMVGQVDNLDFNEGQDEIRIETAQRNQKNQKNQKKSQTEEPTFIG